MTNYASEFLGADLITPDTLDAFLRAQQQECKRRRDEQLAFCERREELFAAYAQEVEARVGREVLQRLTAGCRDSATSEMPPPGAPLTASDVGVEAEAFAALQRDYQRRLDALVSAHDTDSLPAPTRPTLRRTSPRWEFISPPYDGGDAQAYPSHEPYTVTFASCHPDSGDIRHRVRIRALRWEATGTAESWVYKTVRLNTHGEQLSVRAWLVPHAVEQVAGVYRNAWLFYHAEAEQDFYAELGVQRVAPQINPAMWARVKAAGYEHQSVSIDWLPPGAPRCYGFYVMEHPLITDAAYPTETAEFQGGWYPDDVVVFFAKFVSRNRAQAHLGKAHSLMWHEHQIVGINYHL